MNQRHALHRQVFATKALRLSPADQPFWYTSGDFGPYYLNTHFLFGSEEEAKVMLSQIEKTLEYPLGLPRLVGRAFVDRYHCHEDYRLVIDRLAELTTNLSFDFISGGARRDYFFSFALAEKLGKPHLALLKDGQMIRSDLGFRTASEVKKDELKGSTALHVADLVTEASSYFRCWLPALADAGCEIRDTLAVVDRNQGGREALEEQGISLHSLLRIDDDFFRAACEENIVSAADAEHLAQFSHDPEAWMRDFLKRHPNFLDLEAKKDSKTRERVARFRSLHNGGDFA